MFISYPYFLENFHQKAYGFVIWLIQLLIKSSLPLHKYINRNSYSKFVTFHFLLGAKCVPVNFDQFLLFQKGALHFRTYNISLTLSIQLTKT